MIAGLEACGWQVKRFIAGDRSPDRLTKNGSERILSSSPVTRLAADMGRLAYRALTPGLAARTVGTDLGFVYERYGAFQAIGRRFQRYGVPWVLETNSLYFEEAALDRRALALSSLERSLELAAYRRCDVLVSVSEALRSELLDAGIARDVLVVPNGVDGVRFDPSKHARTTSARGSTIVFVGSAIDWQGVEVLLRALALVRETNPRAEVLVIGDGPALQQWRAISEELELSSAVTFTGRVPWGEVPALLARGAVGFVGHRPSSSRTMYHSPLKLYEYLAMGLPVIATREADAERVLLEGTGFFFDGDVPSCAKAITDALEALSRDTSLPQRSRELALRQSWESRARMVLRAVSDRGAGPAHEGGVGTEIPPASP